jgi:hypothetical protein
MQRLPLRPLFELTVSAASGLVVRDGVAWVAADDRFALDAYRIADGASLPAIELQSDGLKRVLRKKEKPDLEALLDVGNGDLLALGSGSKPNRELGYRARDGHVETIDLSALYDAIRARIGSLNIEGAVRRGPHLILAHRSNGKRDASCIVRVDADMCLSAPGARWPATALADIAIVRLGELDGVPLAFTDLALHPDGTLNYLAAAEHTEDAYLDGPCKGSVIGWFDAQFRAHHIGRLQPDVKAEGLAWWKNANGSGQWLVVTDADDPQKRATLFVLDIPVKACA